MHEEELQTGFEIRLREMDNLDPFSQKTQTHTRQTETRALQEPLVHFENNRQRDDEHRAALIKLVESAHRVVMVRISLM